MKDDDKAIPARLRGRIEATKMVLNYAREMCKALDAGLRYGFSELALEQEAKLETLREEALSALRTDQSRATAYAGGAR